MAFLKKNNYLNQIGLCNPRSATKTEKNLEKEVF